LRLRYDHVSSQKARSAKLPLEKTESLIDPATLFISDGQFGCEVKHGGWPHKISRRVRSIVRRAAHIGGPRGEKGGFLSGRSLQQSDADPASVEVNVSVSSALKLQCCRSLCFWKLVGLHPICKIEFRLRPESFLSIREYASYYRLPLWRRVVGQYLELETLPYLDFRLHLNSWYLLSF